MEGFRPVTCVTFSEQPGASMIYARVGDVVKVNAALRAVQSGELKP